MHGFGKTLLLLIFVLLTGCTSVARPELAAGTLPFGPMPLKGSDSPWRVVPYGAKWSLIGEWDYPISDPKDPMFDIFSATTSIIQLKDEYLEIRSQTIWGGCCPWPWGFVLTHRAAGTFYNPDLKTTYVIDADGSLTVKKADGTKVNVQRTPARAMFSPRWDTQSLHPGQEQAFSRFQHVDGIAISCHSREIARVTAPDRIRAIVAFVNHRQDHWTIDWEDTRFPTASVDLFHDGRRLGSFGSGGILDPFDTSIDAFGMKRDGVFRFRQSDPADLAAFRRLLESAAAGASLDSCWSG